jgi:hypothetical protein
MVPAPVAGAMVQVTPASAESFVTVALNVTELPAVTLAVLFVMLTETDCVVCDEPLPLQPNTTAMQIASATANPNLDMPRDIESLLVSASRATRFAASAGAAAEPCAFTRRENDGNGGGSIQLGVKRG